MSKKTAKQQVLDMIAKREREIKRIKKNTRNKTYQEYIMQFIEQIESLYFDVNNEVEFSLSIDSAAEKLYGRLKTFDPGIHAEVIWNSPDHWRDLRVVGVNIRWSKEYRLLNKNVDEEEFVDVTHILFNDVD